MEKRRKKNNWGIERKVEQERDKNIDIWTECKMEISNKGVWRLVKLKQNEKNKNEL
jgi:hypothetical protein